MAGKELEIAFIIICLLPIFFYIVAELVQDYRVSKSRGIGGGSKTLFKDTGGKWFP